MRGDVTMRQFLKIAGAGAGGAAIFGLAATLGFWLASYLPKGGAKMNVLLVNLARGDRCRKAARRPLLFARKQLCPRSPGS